MNRHTSNPFLAGWDDVDEDAAAAKVAAANSAALFDPDTPLPPDSASGDADAAQKQANTRRHSTGQHEITANPFGAQRAAGADRRLYHRNMSSFEAASLQLEQHERAMKERERAAAEALANAAASGIANQTELIAQMTADFQSAIETNDKHFEGDDVPQQNGNSTSCGADAAAPIDLNAFDPFETIVDDDVSLPSPGKAASSRTSSRPSSAKVAVAADENKAHDSIDEDDAELVSTPVRQIKSADEEASKQQQQLHDQADSVAKASIFASLLASAESTADSAAAQSSVELNNNNTAAAADEAAKGAEEPLAEGTRVIKGSPTSDGDRPVSFFDPFETVIDKDALTSLMTSTNDSASAVFTASASVETVVENTDAKPAAVAKADEQQEPADVKALPRPKISARAPAASSAAMPTIATPRKSAASRARAAAAKEKRKPRVTTRDADGKEADSNSSDSNASSDDSDDDELDRIKVVIRARDLSSERDGAATQTGAPVLVPLLPPPPSKSQMKQVRERGQVEDMPSPVMSYKSRARRASDDSDDSNDNAATTQDKRPAATAEEKKASEDEEEYDDDDDDDKFVIQMHHSDDENADDGEYAKPETPLYDEDTSYVLEEYPAATAPGIEPPQGWHMMLRYPPKKKLTANRFWKKIYVKIAEVPVAPVDAKHANAQQQQQQQQPPATCIAMQIYDKPEDRKPMQEIPIQPTYSVSDISVQQFDQFGKIFTLKLQYIFYKERVGVRQGQLARFIHNGHIGTSTTSGGHGVDPISIGAVKRLGAPIEHSPQVSQIIKLGCAEYDDIRSFKSCLEDHLFRMHIPHIERTPAAGAAHAYKTEEVQMAVRDETYIELNHVGQVQRQMARVRLFYLSFLNGTPTVEVGINDITRQGREIVGRMDILPVVTEEWIRLEACELHSVVDRSEFENEASRIIKLQPPDATFFELMRFRIRPPRNRELPLQLSANMSVTRTKVSINCEVMVPGCVSRKHGQIACENIAIRIQIPECWIYFFREEKHFRMGSKKSVNRRPGKVKGIERFLGGGGALQDVNDDSNLIEVTSGQAKYEHHHHAIVWRAKRWPNEGQAAYVQNTMKIRLPLTAYDKMPDTFYDYVHVEYTMPATTVSHTTLRSISVAPCDDEPAEKYVRYTAKYECKVKMRLSVNLSAPQAAAAAQAAAATATATATATAAAATVANPSSAIASDNINIKQPDLSGHLQREEDSFSDSEDDDGDDDKDNAADE